MQKLDSINMNSTCQHTDAYHLTSNTHTCTLDHVKEETSMSLAGISFVNGKIIAFSDSKSTKYRNGKPYAAEPVQKIFKNEHFVLVCTGTNELPVFNGHQYQIQKLEDWMNSEMPSTEDPWALCKRLFEYLQDKCRQDIPSITIIGAQPSIGNKNCILFSLIISGSSFKYEGNSVGNDVCWNSGADEYVQYYRENTYRLLTDSEDILKKELETCIQEIEKRHNQEPDWYNPVGGEIQVERFH